MPKFDQPAISEEVARQLGLEALIWQGSDGEPSVSTVSFDKADAPTGISAQDRSATVIAATKADAKPEDFRMPGHMFPKVARQGGVLKRTGFTETAIVEFSYGRSSYCKVFVVISSTKTDS